MNMQMVRYGVNLMLGIFFVISFVTGLLKFTLLLRMTGLNMVVLPSALISDVHDWSGVLLCLFVWLHLFLNRRWIISMTKKMLHGTLRDT
jgi:hypothetical protein